MVSPRAVITPYSEGMKTAWTVYRKNIIVLSYINDTVLNRKDKQKVAGKSQALIRCVYSIEEK